jgi:anaerobic ribonucleoside-triphosphate reductase activating protein
MRYNTIRQLDIANGPGCRVSLFVQGCSFNCPGCFNSVAKDFEGGKEFTEQTVEAIFALAEPNHISGLSILGGEPLHPRNRDEVLKLTKRFKEKYPEKTVWIWTGYMWEDIKDLLSGSGVDVVVDGRFEEAKKDLRLKYRGSSNQRVIDVPTSLKTNKVIGIEGEG